MAIEGNTTTKEEIIQKHRSHENDTGSPEVQIALITDRLQMLARHFEKHTEDKHSKRGMMALISRRKRLLQYLKNEDVNRYRTTLSALGLRK